MFNSLRRSGLFLSKRFSITSTRYLSGEFVKVLNTRFENPSNVDNSQWQLASVSKNPNASNIDLFVNNLSPQDEDRRQALLDLLVTLRASHLTQQTLESTHFAAIRFLLENATIQELLPVLENRLKYGLFMDDFTAFAVLNAAHSSKEYSLAQPLIQKVILLDELEGLFVQKFAVKSCLMKLKSELFNPPASAAEENASDDVVKVRVKFIRNPLVIDHHLEMSKVLNKVLAKVNILTAIDYFNTRLIALILAKQYSEIEKFLEENLKNETSEFILYSDVYEVAMELLKRQEQEKLLEKLEQFYNNTAKKDASVQVTMEKHLDEELHEAMLKEENDLAEREKKLFPKWQEQRLELYKSVNKEASDKERKEGIDKILDDISTREQKLWYFENRNKIDLQIFNKRVYYPKRWFGKKKKPHSLDENYIPPEIR